MRCKKCQTELPETTKFCPECGLDLQITASAPEGPHRVTSELHALQPERKRITALFSDLSGYTAMTEKLDPEQVREITGRIFKRAIEIIAAYEGFVERVLGDGLLAYFGVPRVQEDDPIRAIRAASEIHDFVKSISPQYEEKYGVHLTMHSGLNTGLVVTAEVDPEKGAHGAAGDAVNVARRLSDLARPGEILVGQDTRIRSQTAFAFEDLGLRNVKGRVEPVRVFRVLSAGTGVGVAGPDRQVLSEMVGRDNELAKLELQLINAMNGEGSVVNVFGEAGVGKSRLIAELKRNELVRSCTLLEGRTISMGKNLGFHPIVDLLQRWAGIDERASEATAFARLETAVSQVCREASDEILPFVATLMGMKLSGKHADRVKDISGEALERLIFYNVRELLARATRIAPVVVVMEDLHWADASSLLLLSYLYRLALTQRVVFINVFRLGYGSTEDGQNWVLNAEAPDLPIVEIPIQPLDPDSSGALIDNILRIRVFQHRVKEQIIERAGGNPYFIEELVRSLMEEGAVKVGENGFDVTDAIHALVIPPTVNEVLMARIDRLDEECRNLVKVGSVIGKSFFDRVLKEVADSVENVGDRLLYLEEVQLILSRMRMEELEHVFKHALVQEVAYESILLERRKEIHRRIAQTIERIFSDRLSEFYGTLAYHYGRGEVQEKTEYYLIKAGEEALKRAASNEALYYFQEALSIYRMLSGSNVDPEKVAMLEKNIGQAFFNRGRYAEAVEHFDEALKYYWREFPKNTFSSASCFLFGFLTFLCALYFPSRWFKNIPNQRDVEAVDLFYKRAQAHSVIDPKRFFMDYFYFQATFVHFDFTKFRDGVRFFAGTGGVLAFSGVSLSLGRRILDYAKPRLSASDTKQCAGFDQCDTTTRFLAGQWTEITELDEDLVNRALKIGEMWDPAMCYYWHGVQKIYQGHFVTARSMVARLSELAEAYENDVFYLLKYVLNGHLLVERRLLSEAIAELDRGIDYAQRRGVSLSVLHLLCLKAWIQPMMGEIEEARESLDHADRVRSEVQVPPVHASIFFRSEFQYYLRCLEDALGSDGRKDASLYRKKALKSGNMLIKACGKAAMCRTDSYRLMGGYNWLTQDKQGAFKWWSKAIEEAEKLGARAQQARTYAEMAVAASSVRGESSVPGTGKADEYLQKARAMLGDLDLGHDLDHLDSAMNLICSRPSQG